MGNKEYDHNRDHDGEERGLLVYIVTGFIAALGLLQALRGERSRPIRGGSQSDEAMQPASSQPTDDPDFVESVERGYEIRDWDIRYIIAFGVVMFVAAVVIHVAIWWMLEGFAERSLSLGIQIPPALVTPREAPGPGVDAAPVEQLQEMREGERELLTGYGWIDREAGVVRIPIDRAMELTAERGLPARDAEVPDFGSDPAYELESEGGQDVEGVGADAPQEEEDEEAE